MGQRKFIESGKLVIALQKHGGNQSAAAKECGITRQAVRDRLKKDPLVRSGWKKFILALEKCGATDTKIAKTIVAGLDATKTATYEGQVMSSGEPDHDTRLKAAEACLKIKCLIGEEGKKLQTQYLNESLGDKKTADLVAEIRRQLNHLDPHREEEESPV